jgi:site-specific DNA-methyltransferase (adenine-specific)
MKPTEIIGNCHLYLGDCREIMPTIPRVDCVITDPPYGSETHSNAKSNKGKGHGNKTIDFDSVEFEDIDFLLNECAKICDRWFVATMEWRHIAELWRVGNDSFDCVRFGVWVKPNPMPQISADRPANGWEGIAYLHKKGIKKYWFGGGKHGNYTLPIVTNGDHPTGKPIQLAESFVSNFVQGSGPVFDPFMGSGTTGVACANMGKTFYGIEREEKYFVIACRRIEQAYAQARLFA